MSDPRPLLIDIGSHLVLDNGPELDLATIVHTMNVRGVLVRAHRADWPDPAWEHFVSESERLELPWGSWHVLSRHINATVQAEAWITRPAGPLGRWIDYETWKDGSIPTGTQLIEAWDRCERADQRTCGAYSRYMLIDRYLNAVPTSLLNARPWWLAQYLYLQQIRGEHPGPPTLPARIRREQVYLHQTADKLAPEPKSALPNAHAMDRDRWVAPITIEQYTDEGVEPPELPLNEQVRRLTVEARLRGWDV